MQEQATAPHSASSPVRRGSALGPSPLSMKGRPSHGHSSSMGSISMGSNKSLNARQGFNQVCSQPHLAVQLGLGTSPVVLCDIALVCMACYSVATRSMFHKVML